jgi:hypothetical protein
MASAPPAFILLSQPTLALPSLPAPSALPCILPNRCRPASNRLPVHLPSTYRSSRYHGRSSAPLCAVASQLCVVRSSAGPCGVTRTRSAAGAACRSTSEARCVRDALPPHPALGRMEVDPTDPKLLEKQPECCKERRLGPPSPVMGEHARPVALERSEGRGTPPPLLPSRSRSASESRLEAASHSHRESRIQSLWISSISASPPARSMSIRAHASVRSGRRACGWSLSTIGKRASGSSKWR